MINVADQVVWTEQLGLDSETIDESEMYGPRARKKIIIQPEFDRRFSFRTFSAFINDFDLVYKRKVPKGGLVTFTFFDREDPTRKIIAHITTRYEMFAVIASRSFLEKYAVVQVETVLSESGSQGRDLLFPMERKHYKFVLRKNLEFGTSIAIIRNMPLFLYPKTAFSKCFRLFAKTIRDKPFIVPDKIDTHHIYEYTSLWHSVKKQEAKINSFETFYSNISGHVFFNLKQRSESDILPAMIIDKKSYTIVSGVYITPYARHLVANHANIINGLLFDTTWKLIPYFVTSILMISTFNIGMPVAFSFGPSEDKDLYEMLISRFKEKFNIDLKIFKAESDQGSALKSVCDSFQVHLACIRHFLVSLGSKPFSFQIGNIISCRSPFELKLLFERYATQFADIKDERLLKCLHKTLFKVGLQFENDVISINDEKKWSKISLLKRVEYKMPSTTNSLESTHGHLNEKIPRRNMFWPSLHRLIKSIATQDFHYKNTIIHCYEQTCRKVKNRVNIIPKEQMENEKAFFKTSKDKCECGETALESKLFQVDIPCSHRFSCGERFGKVIPPTILFKHDEPNRTFEYKVRERESTATEQSMTTLKTMAVKQIRRYSHFKNKAVIKEFVESKMTTSTEFANGKPVSYYMMIHEGILFFDAQNLAKKDASVLSESSETQE